jgi:hypothetical protein
MVEHDLALNKKCTLILLHQINGCVYCVYLPFLISIHYIYFHILLYFFLLSLHSLQAAEGNLTTLDRQIKMRSFKSHQETKPGVIPLCYTCSSLINCDFTGFSYAVHRGYCIFWKWKIFDVMSTNE